MGRLGTESKLLVAVVSETMKKVVKRQDEIQLEIQNENIKLNYRLDILKSEANVSNQANADSIFALKTIIEMNKENIALLEKKNLDLD